MAPTKKTDETGREILVYDDGTIKDAKTGHFLRGPTDNPVTRDPRGMLARRYSISQKIAQNAVDQGFINKGILDPSQAGTGAGWFQSCLLATERLIETTNGRNFAELFRVIAISTGHFSKEETEKGSDQYSDEAKVIFSMNALKDLLREAIQPASVDGKVIE